MERCEVIGRLKVEQKRLDLKLLLERLEQKQIKELPQRLNDLLCKLQLYESGTILESGKILLDKGTVLTEEYGHYEVWYLCNDEWLGSQPVSIRRISAKNKKEQNTGKKKGNWERNIPTEKQFSKNESIPIHFYKEEGMHNLSLMEVDAILPQQNQTQGSLFCKLNNEGYSSIEITSKVKWGHENSPENIYVDLDWKPEKVYKLLPEIAEQIGKEWDFTNEALLEDYPPEIEDELIKYKRKEHALSKIKTKSAGSFENIKIKDMKLRAGSRRCAENWLQNLMRIKWSESYTSIQDTLDDQKEWLNCVALKNYDLEPLEGEKLLEFMDRNACKKAYWHIAALHDLIPSGVKARSLAFTLRESDMDPISNISSRLGIGQSVNEVSIIDRYASKENQILTIQRICHRLNVSSVSLITLKQPESLPKGWKYISMGKKNPDNHDRYWCIKSNNRWEIWKCSTSPDFLSFENNNVSVRASATFTPLDGEDIPTSISKHLKTIEEVTI